MNELAVVYCKSKSVKEDWVLLWTEDMFKFSDYRLPKNCTENRLYGRQNETAENTAEV